MASSSSDAGFILAFVLLVSIFSSFCLGSDEPTEHSKSLARGWGDQIHWRTLSDAIALSHKADKPVMLIIHKTWCRACKKLKAQFSTNAEIAKLSEHFAMVNLEDNEEPKEDVYAPDGSYIPRILFVDGKANVRTHHKNDHGNVKYRYFYSTALEVTLSMKKVIDTWFHDSDEPEEDGGDGQVYDEL